MVPTRRARRQVLRTFFPSLAFTRLDPAQATHGEALLARLADEARGPRGVCGGQSVTTGMVTLTVVPLSQDTHRPLRTLAARHFPAQDEA